MAALIELQMVSIVKTKLKFLFLESFFGGSHREFARGLVSHSKHRIDLVTMPARFWKWRMRGAALYFVNKIPSLAGYNGLITTGLMSLSDYKALSKGKCPPALAYFHETQLTYPLAPGERMDYQFGFTDITTALAAKRVLFNSRTHRESFFSKLPGFLKMMPEDKPIELPTMIAVGVARPSAQGHAITSTAIDILKANRKPDWAGPYQTINVRRAITITAGTNQLETASANL